MSYPEAFKETVGIEGGYVFDPDDRGGETKYGISKRSYPHLDIKKITLAQAKTIYYQDYWKTHHGDLNKLDPKIGFEIFDTGVNMGIHRARKMLQESLNLLNRNEVLFKDINVDGWIGETTLRTVKKVRQSELLKTLNGLQFVAYYEDVKENKEQERFFGGWVQRT